MRVSRRSFLGGAVGSLALLFGGFGWKQEPLDAMGWGQKVPMTQVEQDLTDIDPWVKMQKVTGRAMKKQMRETMDEMMDEALRTGAGDSKIQIWREE